MARGIKRSLIKDINKPNDASEASIESASIEANVDTEDAMPTPPAFKKASSGAGSAWKSGALAQSQADLDEAREDLGLSILAGDQVIEIDPKMINDPIGSDRRSDWMEQDDFLALVESIEQNGQDMPILVWPKDPNWKPDTLEPKNLERVQFLLLAGRRRSEASRKLGRPVRAVIASQEGRGGSDDTFNMLVLRFRENEEREDLSAFERLLSIGQMYDELSASSEQKTTAKDFAKRIGVHESIVSRARAVYKAKDEILNAFKNAYDMSFHELQSALSKLSATSGKQMKTATKPKKLRVLRKVGSRNLSVETSDGRLSIKTTGVSLNKERLEGLSDLIADYLNNKGST